MAAYNYTTYYYYPISYQYQAINVPDTTVRAGDNVKTPLGNGKVALIDDNDTVCVELETEKEVLFEFSRAEVEKITA